MWKCKKCGALNDSNFCKVCNEAMPEPIQQFPGNYYYQRSDTYGTNTVHNNNQQQIIYVDKPKKNTALIVICSILSFLLVAALAVIIISFSGNRSQQNQQDIDLNRNTPSQTIDSEEVPPFGYAENEEKTVTADDFNIYTNDQYNFFCAYPTSFNSVAPHGVNALKAYQSPDGTALMTIRATTDRNGISIEQAIKDFHYEYEGEVTYQQSGSTWFAISVVKNNRTYYRKLFLSQGNIYCFDFECNQNDLYIYSQYVEYIEDNFHPY